jgi:hypothetical protein
MTFHRLTILAAALAFLLNSCSPRHPGDMRAIDSLRVEAEQLVHDQSVMGYENWVFGKASNQDSLYRLHEGLFTRENIALLKRAEQEEPDSVQKKRLHYFRRYVSLELLGKETAPLSDRVNTLETEATVLFDGRRIPYRQTALFMANEADQQRRAALYAAIDPVLDTLNTSLAPVTEAYHRLARDLGYNSYNAMIEELTGLSLNRMKSLAEHVLDATDSVYAGLLQELVPHVLRRDPKEMYRHDTPRLFRNPRFDPFFPKNALLRRVKDVYRSLGVDLETQKNIAIDASERDAKNPRAKCYAIAVPTDIRLSIKPTGGSKDYAALFHEMGHGQHYANTTEHAFEFKYLGEPTVTETYAFLSEYLLLNPAWLRLHSGLPVPILKDFVKFQAFQRLFYVRRYCAKFLYELAFHSGASSPETLYANLLSRAVGYQRQASDEKRFLTDTDAHYYAASYLRAWFLEARLNAKLTHDYGTNWFENPAAGNFLRSLWSRGDRLNGEELARLLGDSEITIEPWLAEIKDMLRLSAR